MSGRLNCKVALVAGAGSTGLSGLGNGKATAITFAREGAAIMAVDLDPAAAEKTREIIEAEGGKCVTIQADVSSRSDCQLIAEKCLSAFGRIDILLNNVGVETTNRGGILNTSEAEWDRLMEINLKSMFLTSQAVLPAMLEHGSGSIVNISSIAAERFRPGGFLYCVSKAGVNALTRSLSIDFADKGIRINAIMPGFIDTPMIDTYGDDHEARAEARRMRTARVPMKKMGEAWDVANASLFLVSDEARYITGHVLVVDGGFLNRIL